MMSVAVAVLSSLPCSVPCDIDFFRFARILNRCRWNSQEVIITTNRLKDYIWAKLKTGTREQDTRENSNRSMSVGFVAMSNRCWRLANGFTNATDDGRCDRGSNFTRIWRFHLQISYYYYYFLESFLVQRGGDWAGLVKTSKHPQTFFTLRYRPSATSLGFPKRRMHTGMNKKLSYRRETARRFVSLNILLSHSRSLEWHCWVGRV